MRSKKWHVFYTYPKSERKINELLQLQNFESFLPLHWVVRQWSDRKKRLLLPLFPSYIFVNIEAPQLYEVLKIPKVINCVKFNGSPAFLREEEVDSIMRMINTNYHLELCRNFNVGDSIIISKGALQGMRGTLIKNGGRGRFIVEIESIKQAVIVNVPVHMLENIDFMA